MKRKVIWVAIALVLFDIGFVSNAGASRRADARRHALASAEAAPVRARQFYPMMDVTVRTPVQLPDQILVPGEYTFTLVYDRDNVSIAKANGELVGTYQVVPAYRRDASGGLVNIADAPNGGPDRIIAWFFPDQQDGYSFLYPSL
jgi:hypothetical protein